MMEVMGIPALHQLPREVRNVKAWAKQILYWRTHLDAFIVDY